MDVIYNILTKENEVYFFCKLKDTYGEKFVIKLLESMQFTEINDN